MTLHLRIATEADLPGIGRVVAAAFHPSTNAITRYLFPPHLNSTDDSAGIAAGAWRLARKTASLGSPRNVMTVVVDNALEGEVVGFALWETPTQGEGEPAPAPGAAKQDHPGLDREAHAELKRVCTDDATKHFGEQGTENLWHLDCLGVDPKQQRRGIGKILLDWGMAKAAEQGKDCYLIATPAGYPFYQAAGFEDLGPIIMFGARFFSMIKRGTTS